MHKHLLFAILFFFSFCLSHCVSQQDTVDKQFKTIDHSLHSANKGLSAEIKELQYQLNSSRKKNEPLALKADSIVIAADAAVALIDSLIQLQKELDPGGDRLDISTKMLVNTPASRNLKKKLQAVSSYCYASITDTNAKAKLDTILLDINESKTVADWDERYFQQTPTVAAITILNKFENDCKNAETYCLDLIVKELLK